ncbi:MAG: hypothetical protein GF331_25990 [Chitinivibrionales bacterium]|nr:hypothetical protein [Chitinivibrionales bacterium]
MLLRPIGRITPLKLALTFVLGFAPAFVPRVLCERGPDWAFCFPVSLSQFFPYVRTHFADLDTALRVLQVLTRPFERILDVGYAFVAVSLVLLAVSRRQPLPGADTRDRITFVALCAFVLVYVLQQLSPAWGGAAVLLTDGIRLGVSTLLKDLIDLTVYAWVLSVVLHDPGRSTDTPKVATLRLALAIAALCVQATGMLYRYTGLAFAPTPSFALLLGAAFVIAPLQLFLLLVTSYHFPAEGAGYGSDEG